MRVHAFIVWEPVLATDVGPPSVQVLSQLKDSRAEQWWDKGKLLSSRVLAEARAGVPVFASFQGEQKAAWDLVGVYPPGSKWQALALPTPVYCGNPLVDSLDSLRARLE